MYFSIQKLYFKFVRYIIKRNKIIHIEKLKHIFDELNPFMKIVRRAIKIKYVYDFLARSTILRVIHIYIYILVFGNYF